MADESSEKGSRLGSDGIFSRHILPTRILQVRYTYFSKMIICFEQALS